MKESNLNNYVFSNLLTAFGRQEIARLEKQVDDAFKIVSDVNYAWKDAEQKKAAEARFDQMKGRLEWLKNFQEEGQKLCTQHENIANKLCRWYERWYGNVSNEGHQEKEMLSMQADELNEIFSEIYQELKVLNLDIKAPRALNLK